MKSKKVPKCVYYKSKNALMILETFKEEIESIQPIVKNAAKNIIREKKTPLSVSDWEILRESRGTQIYCLAQLAEAYGYKIKKDNEQTGYWEE